MSHDLPVAARIRVRQQRRGTAVAVAAGMTALALVVGFGWVLGGPTQTASPPAGATTTSATPTPSATPTLTPTASPTVNPATKPPRSSNRAEAKNVVLNTWLEQPNGFTDLIASVPSGGRIYCTTEVVARSANGDDLYVRARCSQIYAQDGTAAEGSGVGSPLVMHVTHQFGADGRRAVERVTGIDYPRDSTYNEDIKRLFPAGIIRRLVSGARFPPDGPDLLTRAQADIDAGRLGAPTDGRVIAARFLAYAQGDADSLPVDTPVRLYLGNRYQKSIRPDIDGRLGWNVCLNYYAARTCPMSAIAVLRNRDVMPSITDRPSDICLAELPDPPADTGGTHSVVLQPLGADCVQKYVVRVWFNDLGQITAVNLSLGEP
jgi:hypothetical protein